MRDAGRWLRSAHLQSSGCQAASAEAGQEALHVAILKVEGALEAGNILLGTAVLAECAHDCLEGHI